MRTFEELKKLRETGISDRKFKAQLSSDEMKLYREESMKERYRELAEADSDS